MLRTLLVIGLVSLAGCGNGPEVKGPGLAFGPGVQTLYDTSALVGYWYACLQQPCSHTMGVEFDADGTYAIFAWDAKWNAFCVQRAGTYVWDGSKLTTSSGTTNLPLALVVTGDTATMTEGTNQYTLERTYLSGLAACPASFFVSGQ